MKRQTLIPLSVDPSSFDNYYVGENRELVTELQRLVRGKRQLRVLYMSGESGCGKTHLLAACCDLAQNLGVPYIYLPVGQAPPPPDLLTEITPATLVAVDNFQHAEHQPQWQSALFAAYEKLLPGATNAQRGGMVVCATKPMPALNLGLKDLESRLASGGVFRIAELGERDKMSALRARALDKGFELNDAVLQFIITYYQRDTASLFALLDRIDAASLRTQRKITVPFVKTLLQQSLL